MTKVRLMPHLKSIFGASVLIFATLVVSLQLAQGQALQVSPPTGIAASGPQGGPFSASKFTYRLAGTAWVNVTGDLAGMASECGNSTMVSAVPNSSAIIAGIAQKGLWQSTVDGTWTQLGTGGSSDVITNRPSSISYDPANASTFYESGIYNSYGAYKTTDGGTTFAHLGSVTHNDFISVDYTDPNRRTMLVGGHEQSRSVWKSTNAGSTWTNIGTALPTGTGFSEAPLVINANTYLVNTNTSWGGGTPGIYRTTNGGTSWSQVSSQDAYEAPLVTASGIIYWPITDGTLLKSTDFGVTWTSVGSNLQTGNPVRPIELPDGSIVAVGNATLVISKDGGGTWSNLGPTLPFKVVTLTYSSQRQGFYISYFDCGNLVLANAFMKLAYTSGSTHTHDFNGDGQSDIAWRDTSGNTAVWLMNGTTVVNQNSSYVATVPGQWAIVGQRDFNGDGMSDMLWRDTSGNVAVWAMNGTTALNQNSAFVANVPTNWSVVGTGDFNGDGMGDILWQDISGNVAIWEMNGTTVLNQNSSFVARVAGQWSIVGTGDFNGDGKADILWQDTSGNVAIWEMNGTGILNQSSSYVANVPGPWSIKGTGDFNGDGKADILWHDTSGNVAIWEMDGTGILNGNSSFVSNVPGQWSIQLTGDFDGDGKSDILWQDTSGNVAVWEMNGTTVLNPNSSFVGNVPAPWSIQHLSAE
jgi:hypothetical protein